MGDYDQLGKKLIRMAVGALFADSGDSVKINFGPGGGSAQIDGTVAGEVAVEIESRVPKQIRGAILDLILHPYRKKLLLLIPMHTGNPETIVQQANAILGRFLDANTFRVLMITDSPEQTIQNIRIALVELGVASAAG